MTDTLILCYHAISPRFPADLSVTPENFSSQLELLLERGYRAATFSEAVHDPPAELTTAVTFDDSYSSVFELAAPIMAELGVPGTVFTPTAYVDREAPMSWPGIDGWIGGPYASELMPMSWDQLGELRAAGWEIGSHTRTHPRLTQLGGEALAEELAGSRGELEQGLGCECRSIAYPFGAEDDSVVRAAHRAGYTAGGALPVAPVPRAQPLRWPRVGVYHGDSLLRFRRKISPTLRVMRRTRAWKLVQARPRLGF